MMPDTREDALAAMSHRARNGSPQSPEFIDIMAERGDFITLIDALP